jgi:iron complex outermembrane recepter protein
VSIIRAVTNSFYSGACALPGMVLLLGLTVCPAARGQRTSPSNLANQSMEDLMNLEVTSVSKKEQKLSEVAAAIFVVTPEDIRRSGATSIPDLLRMVPGLDVAQINSNTWAISARGFNFQFENKLLVLIDGRAVYTPLFGGVYWDTQDVPLEDIERIEVIRGPGGTIWGANAVNGVINIITKRAAETRGTLVVAGGGSHEQEFGTIQYGGKIANHENYRVFAKYLNDGHFADPNGQDAFDDWHLLHTGFRIDSEISQKDTVTTQGDLYAGSEGATIVHSILFPPDNVNLQKLANLSGGNVLARWNHIFSSKSDTSLQFYFDRYTRSGPESREVRNTIDFDFQNHLAWGTRQDLIWGLGYRHTADQTAGTIDQSFVPAHRSGDLFNVFVQDQITLKPDRVSLSVGVKLEDSYFVGFDYQPSAQITWTPSNRHTFWTAISRASQTPTRRRANLEAVIAALPGPAEVVLLGNPQAKSEHVVAYEAGYRSHLRRRVSLDATAFFNVYHDLESVEPQPSFFDNDLVPPLLVHPKLLGNEMRGTTEGVEISVNWKATSHWTISPGYSFLKMHLHTSPTSMDTASVADAQGSSPSHQAQLRSHLELPRGLAWEANAYFVGALPAQFVGSYTRVDTQLRWRLAEELELGLAGQNLLRERHLEFNDFLQSVNSSQVKRSVYLKLTWRL